MVIGALAVDGWVAITLAILWVILLYCLLRNDTDTV